MVSTCQYLFGNEAEQIFKKFRLPHGVNRNELVDQLLELSMKVHNLLFEIGDFHYLDPMAFHDQCHLYALRAAQIGAKKSDKTERSEENKFLHLTLFLSKHFSDLKKRVNIYVAAATVLKLKFPHSENKFRAFLQDEGGCLERASRRALNGLFESYLKGTLASLKSFAPLYQELALMADENLQLETSRKGLLMYTFPKLAGVAYFVDTLARENIPFVVKVKVLTKEGAAGTLVKASHPAKGETPVIVFEGIASDGSYSIPEVRERATNCPTFFFRRGSVHEDEKNCFYCKWTTIDLTPYRERLERVMANPQEMFYALGADFILQQQKTFKPFFENQGKYPLLSKIFKEAVAKIEKLGLEMDRPTTFSVCHVYTTEAEVALSERLLIDRRVG
jgi:hypothetical protein